MTGFAIGVACLLVLAGWMLRSAARTAAAPGSAPTSPIGILHEQLAALDQERQQGRLGADEHAAASAEWQRRFLDENTGTETIVHARGSRRATLVVGIGAALFAAALYAAIGNPAGIAAPAAAQSAAVPPGTAATAEPDVTPEAVQAMLATLAQRLEKPSGDPASDLQGWTMLARSYAALQRFGDADRAYARAIALAPADAQLLADRADVLAMLQGQRTVGEPDRLIAEALRLDPSNIKALALAGSAAYERDDWTGARRHWQQARQLAPAGSEFAAGLDRSLAEVAARSGEAPAPAPATAPEPAPATSQAQAQAPAPAPPRSTAIAPSRAPTPTAAPAAVATAVPSPNGLGTATGEPVRISGRVALSPALAARVAPDDTVFVFARAAEGSRMPLAIVRRTAADLPFSFTLDDSQAMSPQTRLSSAARVIVGVRVSRSGNAMPQPGDLRGESAVIGTRQADLALTIDNVQP